MGDVWRDDKQAGDGGTAARYSRDIVSQRYFLSCLTDSFQTSNFSGCY